MILVLGLSSALAGDADDLARAMGIDPSDLAGLSLTASLGAASVEPAVGTVTPRDGGDLAWLTTGKVGTVPQPGTDWGAWGPADDAATLHLVLAVPDHATSFAFDFAFLSAEYPEYVGSEYDDRFEAAVRGTAWSGNAAIDGEGNEIGINSAFFSITKPADLAGTGYEGLGGGTGWLTVVVPAAAGETVELALTIEDVADGFYDSAVALDHFRWTTADVTDAIVVGEVSLDHLSPKSGPADGSASTTLLGSGFGESCVAWFDGVAAETVLVDEASLVAWPPAHDPGLVDVTVRCTAVEATRRGAYTYVATGSDGAPPPIVEAVEPYRVGTAGGVPVQVVGAGFQAGAAGYVDGEAVPTAFVDAERLVLTVPPHAPGLVDVRIANPDGLWDERLGALLYLDDPAPEPDPPSEVAAGCASAPGGPAWAGLLLLALRRRRR